MTEHLDTLRRSLAALDEIRGDVPSSDDEAAWKHYRWRCGLAMGAVVRAARLVVVSGENPAANGPGGSNE